MNISTNFITTSADATTARKRLALLRRYKSFSQQFVAKKIDVSLRSYQRIEYGERDLDVSLIFKIAELFEVDANFFLNSNTPKPDYVKAFEEAKSRSDKHSSEKKFLAQKTLSLTRQFQNGPIASPMLEQYVEKSVYSTVGVQELGINKKEFRCSDVIDAPESIIMAFETSLQNPNKILITEADVTFPEVGKRHMICVSKLKNPAWDQMKIDVQFIRVPEEYQAMGIQLADLYPLIMNEIQGTNVILAPPVID